MDDYIIIIPTFSKYINLVNNFLQVLNNNWKSCPYKIIISISGDKCKIEGYDCVYNGKNASLIECIRNVSCCYKSRYYICFLGDAFIYKMIDKNIVDNILNSILNDSIDYCSINYVKKYKKQKKYNQYLRYINKCDRYSHSFVSFIASYDYINNVLVKFLNDLEFEKYYLEMNDNEYFYNHLIVINNYFNILPSINKGKWDRINLIKLKKHNKNIIFEQFDKQSWIDTIFDHIRIYLNPLIPRKIRNKLRKILYHLLNRNLIT